ncbi:piwi-like protein Siwi [Tigriopus californicus]|uniref:piwi-like protein Siwi n=1 Tax=Tigriopus californicus TaxID=6832 RepID=UPI0027D9F7A5|nr:piwi-like protein Siwi [Tigriopus californicus]
MGGRGRGRARGGDQGSNGNGAGLAQRMGQMGLDGHGATGGGGGERSMGRGVTRGGARNSAEDIQRRNDFMDLVKTRPASLTSKCGVSGTPVALRANYFKINKSGAARMFSYHVTLKSEMEEERSFVRKIIVRRLAQVLPVYLFDGMMMFTMERLYPEGQDCRVEMSCNENKATNESVPVEVEFKLTGEIFPTDHTYLHVLNIIKNQANDGLQLTQMGRGYYDPKSTIKFPQYKIEIWPGYSTSIRQHENDILMNVDVSMKVLRTDTVLNQMDSMKHDRAAGRDVLGFISKKLIGAIVYAAHNQKTYRIDDIDFNKNATSTFQKKDGSSISFVDYYKTRHGLTINPKQPLLISQPRDRDIRGGKNDLCILVPELCKMTGLSDDQRNNFHLMQEISTYTRMVPEKRVQSLIEFSNRYTSTPEVKATLEKWSLKMNPELVAVNGRILPPERIFLSQNPRSKVKETTYTSDNADWSNAATRNVLWNPVPLDNIRFIYPGIMYNKVAMFFKEMQMVAKGLGVNLIMPDSNWQEIQDTRTASYLAAAKVVSQMKPNFVVVAIPNDRCDTYAAMKKHFCFTSPVPTQMITDSKVLSKDKKYKSVASKVVIQMTTKMGGTPWCVKIPMTKAMIVGFDTYHDTTKAGMSVGAMVATLDSNFSRKTENQNEFPDKIFFYRDGVGDGQVQQVVDHEIQQLENAIKAVQKYSPNWNPQIVFIIVSKRINTKFFVSGGRRPENPSSGTVVDDIVTLPERHDFYLISQSVRQGTVNPTSYNIIKNTSTLSSDKIQMLTYKLCHMYYNWPGTVRVPAPCQYAHKLAYLVGESLHDEPHEMLSKTLYYL